MTTSDKRMDERFVCEVTVDLVWNRQRTRLRTADVGYRGLFLRTDTPPVLRQLLRLEVPLPDGTTLAIHGMAVHVVKVGDASGEPGVGVQFYAVDKDTASRWGRFVDEVRKRGVPSRPAPAFDLAALAAEKSDRTLDASGARKGPLPITAARPRLGALGEETRATPPEAVRRKFPRYDAELELEVRSMEELRYLVSRDVSAGGMFIATDAPIAPGIQLRIVVRHPTRPETFDLDAVVRHRAERPLGIGVEFVGMDAVRRAALMDFLRPSLPMEEILLIDPDDPRLE